MSGRACGMGPVEGEACLKIYTKTGDDGTTGLLGPGRFGKDDLRIEAYGTVDELNAVLGTARALGTDAEVDARLADVQNELFAVGSALADPDPSGRFHGAIGPAHLARIERWIDTMEEQLPSLSVFIVPGGSPASAQIHLARAVCRRAERAVVRLAHQPGAHVDGPLIAYLNRLSDALFVLARLLNRRAGLDDTPWGGL
jgi:cob(I)alamin adenosyltransferase